MKTTGDSMLDNWDDITEEVTAVETPAAIVKSLPTPKRSGEYLKVTAEEILEEARKRGAVS